MRKTLGMITMIASVALGLYVGIWWAFIGGIVHIIELIQGKEVVAIELAITIVKVFGASALGVISGAIPFVGGWFLFMSHSYRGRMW